MHLGDGALLKSATCLQAFDDQLGEILLGQSGGLNLADGRQLEHAGRADAERVVEQRRLRCTAAQRTPARHAKLDGVERPKLFCLVSLGGGRMSQ